ncbi:serine hydrolase domain-containing protein [Paenibacillus glycanilyticus]|nr:serine hydrolase domain-containing protein [Paenibacillus glycanilyticus]
MLDQTAISQIKATIRKSVVNNEVAGANFMVIKNGEEVFYHEDGLADRESGRRISRDTIFRLYSMTKPVTATAVMILVERGEIDLFDSVSQYLPGFKNQKFERDGELVPVEREMNIHDLLDMTCGLVYGGSHAAGQATEALFREIGARLLGDEPLGTVDAMNRLGEGPLAFQPGTSWAYGTSADVLGAVVEVVSGMRFGEFLQKEMFGPLGMLDTGFWLPEEKRARLVNSYATETDGMSLFTGNHLGIIHQMDRNPAFESGGAGLVSTIDDAAKFTTMLLNKGSLNGVQILRPRTVEYLTSGTLNARQQLAFENWHTLAGHSYGNLMRVMVDTTTAGILASPGEYGWDGWLGVYFANFPAEDLTILVMIQKKDAGTIPLTRKLRNIVLSTL